MTVRELLRKMKKQGISKDTRIDIAFSARHYDENGLVDDEWDEIHHADGVVFGLQTVTIYVNN